jgi:hypothetical protein
VACRKHGDSCLCVVVDDFGGVDLGACVWCKTQSVGCSTAQCRCRGGVSKAKVKSEGSKGGKQKACEVEESEEREGEGPSSKKVESHSVIEDSGEEGDWHQDRENRPKKDMGEAKVAQEIRASLVSEAEVQGKAEDKGKGKAMEERKARRSERTEMMRDLTQAVRELGDKVDRFADEVRVSNVLRNRVDREYLEERRYWYFSERLANAGESNKDLERYSAYE